MEEARDERDERECEEEWERGAEELDEVQRLADKSEQLAVAEEEHRAVMDREEETGVRVQLVRMDVTARRLNTLQQRVNGMTRKTEEHRWSRAQAGSGCGSDWEHSLCMSLSRNGAAERGDGGGQTGQSHQL